MLRSTRATRSPPCSLVEDPAWQSFKDTFYTVLAQAHAARADATQVPAARHLGAALARLPPPAADHAGPLYDKAHDLGRLVCAKHVLGDDLPTALGSFSAFLAGHDLGRLETTAGFHRAASLLLHPDGAGTACDPHVLATWITGALHGLLEEAFNCRVSVTPETPNHLTVRLLEGRDVNLEARKP